MPASTAERRDLFLRRAVEMHGDRFECDPATFRGDYRPMVLICPDHGWFEATPVVALASPVAGCPTCATAGTPFHDLTVFDIAAGGADVAVHVELARDDGAWVHNPRPGFDVVIDARSAAQLIIDQVLEQFAFGPHPLARFGSDTAADGGDHPSPADEVASLQAGMTFRVQVTADDDSRGGCQFDCLVLADDINRETLARGSAGKDAVVYAVHEVPEA
ncbi:DUF723 domain-containing protein [Curtobacterium citreum]